MNNFTLGRYVPLDSKIHRIDPRFKIITMLILMTAVFLADFYGYAILFVVLATAILMAKLSFKFILKSMKPMMFMLVFLFIINTLLLREGTIVLQIGSFKIYSKAVIQTLFIVGRLVLMIMVTTLLTATTAPLDLTLGIEDLLSPLRRFKVPAHEIAMMISIVFRFIPTLIDDTQRIMQAQSSRGVDLDEGKLTEKVSGIISMIIPLFVSSFQRAEDLADAMEARGYYPGKERTRYKQLKIRLSDYVALFICIAVLVAVVMVKRFI
ncbi:MAG: energy-coupling factor transporter transmembrane protein EcfT [Erysipelothrix sp.]|nr:energy-coupling factor transporter transmembrane protein EcfT [Erysipelothrix sp.]